MAVSATFPALLGLLGYGQADDEIQAAFSNLLDILDFGGDVLVNFFVESTLLLPECVLFRDEHIVLLLQRSLSDPDLLQAGHQGGDVFRSKLGAARHDS